jgi:hypothetical protein
MIFRLVWNSCGLKRAASLRTFVTTATMSKAQGMNAGETEMKGQASSEENHLLFEKAGKGG